MESTFRLFLIRHGRVAQDGVFYGQRDVPLSEEGRGQMERAAAALSGARLAAVYSSDLQRAAEGARIVAVPHGLEVRADPAFREMHLGLLEGVPFGEVGRRFPEHAARRYQDMWHFRFPEGGENLQDLADRCLPALEKIRADHAGETVALVAHNSINRIVLGQALGLPLSGVFCFAQDFGCINRIDYGRRVQVGLINWTPAAPLQPPLTAPGP